jgi:hypothetical protein
MFTSFAIFGSSPTTVWLGQVAREFVKPFPRPPSHKFGGTQFMSKRFSVLHRRNHFTGVSGGYLTRWENIWVNIFRSNKGPPQTTTEVASIGTEIR